MSNKLHIIGESSLPSALDLSFGEWKEWCVANGFPPFSAKQIVQWLHQKRILDPQLYSNLSKEQRQKLSTDFLWELPTVDSHLVSVDKSEKFLLKARDGQLFEMVLMPYDNRVTLCISSQVGCRMGCTFCQTGKMGLLRNLSSGEILSQLFIAENHLSERKITNIVFMGMGEPLDNYEEVVKACRLMVDKMAWGLSMHRVTISTSGIVPAIERLGSELPLRLAISLHEADEAARSAMMPVNRRYPLALLKEALLKYPAPKRYGVTIEYVMIQGKNDSLAAAKKLVHFLAGLKVKVNLIPINHFPGVEMRPSEAESLRRFQSYLSERSIPAPIRYSRGQDISGGCGQLAAKRKEEVDIDPRTLHKARRKATRSAAMGAV